MKKVMLIILAFALCLCATSCGGTEHTEEESTVATQKRYMLPGDFTIDLDGTLTTVPLSWTDNSLSFQIEGLDVEGETTDFLVSFDDKTGELAFTVAGEKTYSFTYNKDGYVVKTVFDNDRVVGDVEYSEDKTAFTWSLKEGEDVQIIKATVGIDGVDFLIPDIDDEEGHVIINYGHRFINSVNMFGTGCSYQYDLDKNNANLAGVTMIDNGGEEAASVSFTPSDIPCTHPWQKLAVMVPISSTLVGMSGVMLFMQAIVYSYTIDVNA